MGVNNRVGDLVAVIVGEGVRLCVDVGLDVSEGIRGTVNVAVSFEDGIVTVEVVRLAKFPLVFSFIAEGSSGICASELQAEPIKIIMADRNIKFLVLFCRIAIK